MDTARAIGPQGQGETAQDVQQSGLAAARRPPGSGPVERRIPVGVVGTAPVL